MIPWRNPITCSMLAYGLLLAAATQVNAGPAIGQFEIKTLSVEPGEIEFQSQNAYFIGRPRHRMQEHAGEIAADDNTVARQRHGLEVEVGVARFLKGRLGIEYERERLDDIGSFADTNAFGDIELDEYAAEAVVVLKSRSGDGWGLGVVVEYEHPAEAGGSKTLNGGPILEVADGKWIVSVNPTLTQFFGGGRNAAGARDEKIDFSYSARLLYPWSKDIDLALEAYGTVERIGGRGERSDASQLFGDFDQHRVGPVAYWNFEAANGDATLGLGALFGLNSTTTDVALKASFELTF